LSSADWPFMFLVTSKLDIRLPATQHIHSPRKARRPIAGPPQERTLKTASSLHRPARYIDLTFLSTLFTHCRISNEVFWVYLIKILNICFLLYHVQHFLLVCTTLTI
jgi:hypothetical protein